MTKSCLSIRDALKNQVLLAASKEKSRLNSTFCALSFYKYKDMNEKSLESLEMSHSFIE